MSFLSSKLLRVKTRSLSLQRIRASPRMPILHPQAYPHGIRWSSSGGVSSRSKEYPKSVLFNFYLDVKMKEDDMSKIEFEDDFLEPGKDNGNSRTWWTTELYCPLSQKKFKSIEMKTFPEENIEFKEVDSLIYYPRRKDAHHAAAEAALNHLKTIYGVDLKAPIEASALKKFRKYASNARSTLGVYFQQFHQVDIATKEQFTEISMRGDDNTLWYHSTFTDPVEGKSYASGWLRDISWGNKIVQDKEARIYYPLRRLAQQAAAGRFLDEHLKEGNHKLSPYCWDVPGDDSWTERALKEMEKQKTEEISKNLEADVEAIQHLEEQSDDDDEEEFEAGELILTTIPSGLSTMDRVMEAWAEAVNPRETSGHSTPAGLNTDTELHEGLPLLRTPEGERDLILQNSLQWWQSLQRDRSFQGTVTTHSIATGILSTLAKANKVSPSYGIEALAKQIIESIREPTIEEYNHYISCLYGSNPQTLAERAEKIVKQMGKSRRGSQSLLEPNVETLETLIRLWARVGGEVAKEKTMELIDLIRSMETDVTREIYLLLLTTMGNQSVGVVGFDAAKAKEIIEEMQAMLGIDADADMYNAPMYWSPEAPWDDYHALFKKQVDTEKTKAAEGVARAMQSWLKEAEKLGVADIRTYEAVIQAWVRMGTMRGLASADTLALDVLERANDPKSKIHPRLQTFHPILVGLFCTGQVERLQEWCSRLFDVGFNSDSRVRALIIAAHCEAQKSNLGNKNTRRAKAEARKYIQELKQFGRDVVKFHEGKGPPIFLDAEVVRLVIQSSGSLGESEQSIEKMLGAVEILIRTVRQLKRVKNEAGGDPPRLKQQLAHLAGWLPSIFTTVISETERNFVAERSLDVEAFLRFVWENGALRTAMTRIAYSDGFEYTQRPRRAFLRDVTEMCLAVVDGCSRIPARSGPHAADKIRLALTCFDLACYFDRSNGSTSGVAKRTELHRRIITLLGTIESEPERASLVAHLVQRARRETSVDMYVINEAAASVLKSGKTKPVAPWAKKRKQGRLLSPNKP